jgi:hypothetical protein
MQSRAHAAVGSVVSLALVAVYWPDAPLQVQAAAWTYGVALSVLIDLDHFLVTRVTVGDWRHARRVLANPLGAFGDQDWIFDDEDLTELNRLLSHAIIAGVLVPGTWLVAPALAAFTAVVLYAHVLADLLRDNELV